MGLAEPAVPDISSEHNIPGKQVPLRHFIKQVPCEGELGVPQVPRYHGVVGDRAPARHGVEDTESGVAVAVAHVGRNGFVPCNNVRVFEFDRGWRVAVRASSLTPIIIIRTQTT